jgi:hypothetical protein
MLTPAPKWQLSYENAVHETDRRKLASLVALAESEIISRLQELTIIPKKPRRADVATRGVARIPGSSDEKVGSFEDLDDYPCEPVKKVHCCA